MSKYSLPAFKAILKMYLNPSDHRDNDLYSAIAFLAVENGKARMTESLRLIVDDIITDVKARRPLHKGITSTEVLLALAAQKLVRFNGEAGKWILSPTLRLLDCLQVGENGLLQCSRYRCKEIQLDASLIKRRNSSVRMYRDFGKTDSKRTITIRMLLTGERAGTVIAYKDSKGSLAWKSSIEEKREGMSENVLFLPKSPSELSGN
jgi:hypothetical protein